MKKLGVANAESVRGIRLAVTVEVTITLATGIVVSISLFLKVFKNERVAREEILLF